MSLSLNSARGVALIEARCMCPACDAPARAEGPATDPLCIGCLDDGCSASKGLCLPACARVAYHEGYPVHIGCGGECALESPDSNDFHCAKCDRRVSDFDVAEPDDYDPEDD